VLQHHQGAGGRSIFATTTGEPVPILEPKWPSRDPSKLIN